MANPSSIAFQVMFTIAAAILVSATAQSSGPAPSPAVDCFPYLLNLSDCLSFVEGGSNLSKPDPGCCPELSKLVETQPVCLCQLLGNSGQLGITVDFNKAMKLPSVCNVTTPPVSLCAAIGYPVSGPSTSEAPLPGEGEATPASNKGSAASNHHFFLGLAALFYAGLLIHPF